MFWSKKRKKEEVLAHSYKQKTTHFDFDKIERYFRNHDKDTAFHLISDKTFLDLDLDEVFMFADRSISKVGQQFLYHTLRFIPKQNKQLEKRELLLQYLEDKPELKESLILQLHQLNQYEAYYITSLFQEAHIQKPSWYWLIQLMALLSFSTLIASFFIPQLLILLLCILFTNYIIHYWNKKNLFQYGVSIPQLLILNKIVKAILDSTLPLEDHTQLMKTSKDIESIGYKMSVFKLEARLMSDIGQAVDFIIETVKALFLLEPLLLFHILEALDNRRQQIHQLYQCVGEVDVAIAISSFRASLDYYSKPSFVRPKKYIYGKKLYHPLIPDCVSNSITLDGKSALLTGSNMSGKTTFIRTVGINAILAQTFNTCFAKEFVMPRLKVHSTIRISDDLMSDKSYYFEEVLSVKQLLHESQSEGANLFLLDEIFKGTNTTERIAASKSVLSYLHQKDNLVLISSHDLELAEYLEGTFNLYHFTEVVEGENILFDYKIKTGNLKTTNAIRILELNDYPPTVISEARQLLIKIREEKSFHKK